ncbi:MAG TPA: sulfide/dihydroorotate dehydrogenase-like FAD/NAD-binding protein [Eubacteriales bacterium]|jgi:ferredoxin--NADP+ reductase|nr:sulfide/dihydroorotate dehydrogenase-like FAD/NAD-binding protein [Eubacteriales bacterium]HRU83993.1 sulfide/dihydroorotate dehydrogenase-like FAD/NAD-binding protein [Eubacteriales bacterium]
MYKILKKRTLAENAIEYRFLCSKVAAHAKPGQFIILRVDAEGERVPFTICDIHDDGITILVQTVGYTTMKLAQKEEGEYIHDLVGPLGNATDLEDFGKILLVGGGIGTAVVYPQAKHLFKEGKPADSIIGARTASLLVYEDEMRQFSENLCVVTDDGSRGEKGFVTAKLEALIKEGKNYDAVFAVGPLPMMRAVANLTRGYGLKTIVSMNSIMVDGTGMCGCCRLTVGGKVKYACVDGPEFDGHLVDFEEAMARSRTYVEQEKEHICRLSGAPKKG